MIVGIFLGSVVNIPVKRLVRHEDVTVHPFPHFGFLDRWPQLQRVRRETIVAVNLGGCVIPTMVAIYEMFQLVMDSWTYLLAVGVAVAINTTVCYRLARPVKGIGIAMPALVPPIVAVMSALVLAPDRPLPWPSSRECSALFWGRISCICGRSQEFPPAWPASAGQVPLTASSFPESWPPSLRDLLKNPGEIIWRWQETQAQFQVKEETRDGGERLFNCHPSMVRLKASAGVSGRPAACRARAAY